MALDPGNVFRLNYSDWLVSPLAGTSVDVYAGDGGPASAASFRAATHAGLTALTSGTWFFVDVSRTSGRVCVGELISLRIRCFDGTPAQAGTVETVAGNGSAATGRLPTRAEGGADPTAVGIGVMWYTALDRNDNIYFGYAFGVAMVNMTVPRRVYHIACGGSDVGDGVPATSALCGDGTAINGLNPTAIDDAGTLFIADNPRNCVRAVSADGTIRTVAGVCGVPGRSGDGGPATLALLNAPTIVRVTPNPSNQLVYVYDSANAVIRRVRSGNISTVAGDGTTLGFVTGNSITVFGVAFVGVNAATVAAGVQALSVKPAASTTSCSTSRAISSST